MRRPGKSEPASYQIADGRTTVPLHLEPWGTVFVIFRQPATASSRTLPKVVETQLATVKARGMWAFSRAAARRLLSRWTNSSSWNDSSDKGVKYFSGTGAYATTVQAPADWFKSGAQIWIDLGDVKNLAEVTVNGKPLGIVWHSSLSGGCNRRTEAGRERNHH